MIRILGSIAAVLALALAGCASTSSSRPSGGWSAPEAVVAPSAFKGVHGLAVDKQGHLLAGSVIGNSIWQVDRQTGAAKILIGGVEGQADDIAIGPNGEIAWTNFLAGILRYRENDSAPIRTLASNLPGINSLDFDRRNHKFYASQVFRGDALWEIDLDGKKPPRLIRKDLGGLNGFEVGLDGMIYGPLWFKGQVVKIDPADGRITVIADGFETPSGANLDGKGNLWVVDAHSGELTCVELSTGRKTFVKQLKPALDNLAIAPEGTIYVSNMADNSIESFDPATGETKLLISGKLPVAGGLKIDGDTLYVASIFSFRQVDTRTGAVSEVFRMHRDRELKMPYSVGLSKSSFALTGWSTNAVQLVDRTNLKTTGLIEGLKLPYDAVPLADGSVAYIEFGTGTLSLASGPKLENRKVLATGLEGPVQLVLGKDGALYLTEFAGKLTRVTLDGSSPPRALAQGLARPEGLAQTPWGTFIVAETGTHRLTEIDPADGSRRTVAEKLPIGFDGVPGTPPPYIPTGVAVAADGSIYVSSDQDNGVYRIRALR